MEPPITTWEEAEEAFAYYIVQDRDGRGMEDAVRVGICNHDPLASRKSWVFRLKSGELIAITDTKNAVPNIREMSEEDQELFRKLAESPTAWQHLPLHLQVAAHLIALEPADPTQMFDPEFHPRKSAKLMDPDDPTGLRTLIPPHFGGTASQDELEACPDFGKKD